MSVEEKRKIVDRYCMSTPGEKCTTDCVLYQKWINKDCEDCIDITEATEEELDEALALIHGDAKKTINETREIFGLDPIKPTYYNDTKITPFDVIDDWGLNFYLGNAIKYIKRAGKKADNSKLQDLKKVREYIDHEIKAEEGII